MPYVIHHNDYDGKCSAAIVMNELLPVFVKDQIVCIEYNYGYTINWDTIFNPDNFLPNGKEICYIVDVALNDTIFDVIKKLVSYNVKVVHIDHHIGTLDYLKNADKEVMDHVIQFYKTDVSATMLCWVYSCMTEEEREHPMDVEYDFTSTYSHVMINVNTKLKAREYRINPGVFYIDDYDVWRHSTPTTMEFHYGLSTAEDTNPKLDKFWGDIIYGNERVLKPYIDKGSAIVEYKRRDNMFTLKRGHEIIIDTTEVVIPTGKARCFVINQACDSSMFESIKKDYDACIAYWYDARIDKWHYSVRSSDESAFDCNKFCQLYSGSGHKHAAGFMSEDIIFK